MTNATDPRTTVNSQVRELRLKGPDFSAEIQILKSCAHFKLLQAGVAFTQ